MSLAGGVSLFSLARRMGTSVEMIDRTYGHLTPDADDHSGVCLMPTTRDRPRLGSYRARKAESRNEPEAGNAC
jgi:hypothetical protein